MSVLDETSDSVGVVWSEETKLAVVVSRFHDDPEAARMMCDLLS